MMHALYKGDFFEYGKKDHNSLDVKRVLDWGGLRLLLWETFHTWSFSNS